MMKTILLPLDGSPLAERALTYAAVLARQSDARIALVEAVRARTFPGVDSSDAQVELTSQAQAYLQSVADRLAADGVEAEVHVCYADPVPAILDAASRQRADLIVMSTHGRGGLSRMLYGSVADQILRRATIPVLLVPSIVEHAWPADGPLSLLIPLDGSELAAEAMQSACLLTDLFGARLTLLRAIQPIPYPLYGDGYAYVPFDEEAEVAESRRYLDDQVTRLSGDVVNVETEVVLGEPARVIGEVAREKDVDVVVMATHGHGGLSRVILGSVATATLRHTTAPLLLVRPAAVHAAEPPATHPEPSNAATSGQAGDSVLTVQLTSAELELIEHSLRALGHAPGYDYGHVLEARALADRLERSPIGEMGEPVAAR